MPYARRWRWIQDVTQQKTIQGAADRLGVPRSTLSRWLSKGMPVDNLVLIAVEYGCDLVEASVVWGFLREEDVPHLNYQAMVKYVPIDVLVGEVTRRVSIYAAERVDSERKTSVGMLQRVNE